MCDPERNDQSQKHTAQCYVSHSSNTIPTISCVPPSMYEVYSDVRRVNASKCASDKTSYNITNFTINNGEDKQLTCSVRYTEVGNSSAVYSEKQFIVFRDSMNPQSGKDSLEKEIIPNGESGRLRIYNYSIKNKKLKLVLVLHRLAYL